MAINGIKKIPTLVDIPSGKYEGYYWLSDSKEPIMVDDKNLFDSSIFQVNPFVIEAMLWDEDAKRSIMVTHTGKYNIFEYGINDIKKIEGAQLEQKEYLAHKMKDKTHVIFNQLWLPENDDLCEGMMVLKMKAQIFIGFDKKVEK